MNFNKFTIKKSFAISAGAGSGKTYTLSRRFINIILGFDFFIEDKTQPHYYESRDIKKADLEQIVTITYTEAAALEMKERIFGLIHKILIFDEGLHVSSLGKTFQNYGLKIGDRLIQVNGVRIKNQNELRRYIENFKDYSSLLFERNNFQFFVNIK